MSIKDGFTPLDGGSVRIQGIRRLAKDAEAVGVEASDLQKLTHRLAVPIAERARSLAPKGKTRKLTRQIRPSISKRAVMVHVGSRRLPYAAPRHWGFDGYSGPRWLSKAEEQLREQTFAGFGEGIKELLDKHGW